MVNALPTRVPPLKHYPYNFFNSIHQYQWQIQIIPSNWLKLIVHIHNSAIQQAASRAAP